MRHACHGKWGKELYQLCRGLDERPVEPNRVRKSLSNESTFTDNLTTLAQCQREMHKLVSELQKELRAKASGYLISQSFRQSQIRRLYPHDPGMCQRLPEHQTFQTLLEEASARSLQPVRLLGSGVRFAEAANKSLTSSQQDFAFSNF